MTERARDRGGLAVTWGGHSTVLIELDGARLLTDPVVHSRVGPLRRFAAPFQPRLYERVDAVLVSHLHADHAHLRSLRALGADARVIAPRGARGWLRAHGFKDVSELAAGEELEVAGVRVGATQAVHNSHRWHLGERRLWPLGVSAEPVGYLVRGSRSCYFAGDTDLFGAMSELAGTIDIALLPISGWGASVGSGHLDPERAAIAAERIAPSVAVPIHWGTLTLALRPGRPPDPARYPREFAALVAERAPAVDVRILEPGERTALDRDAQASGSAGP